MGELEKEQARLDFVLNNSVRVQCGMVLDMSNGLSIVTRGHKNNRDAIDAAMEILNVD